MTKAAAAAETFGNGSQHFAGDLTSRRVDMPLYVEVHCVTLKGVFRWLSGVDELVFRAVASIEIIYTRASDPTVHAQCTSL